MRGARSKKYRKLMQQYALHFHFREPYQVLLDADIIQDSARFAIDLVAQLERNLHGKIKPMITQCSMRHLYTTNNQDLIMRAKDYERRRCGHHELEEPLTTLECLTSVVDAKGSKTNKNRYVVASQDPMVRATMRRIPGVPLIYINRSVVIMEPMGAATEDVREQEEKGKFRAGIRGARTPTLGKRKRDDRDGETAARDEEGNAASSDVTTAAAGSGADTAVKAKKKRATKEPNPLSVKKPKRKPAHTTSTMDPATKELSDRAGATVEDVSDVNSTVAALSEPAKVKRKRKHKPRLLPVAG
ncbi:hypothetical protein LTS18_012669 [Coniosporium uncinatum]|uniref:Uncharacterized protein n=1 Tax=Coniosporium uncinatum TaxID=93489 RepID=A0ACC3DJ22_9PEZI|nr:hypothetical protein LTS18_012669 [Coniosporium uncinatum]